MRALTTMNAELSPEKLKELVVCLAERTYVGMTKLEKLMYLCDFLAAERLGRPITGETYRNFQLGPVPKHFIPILEDLILSGAIKKTEKTLASGRKFVKLDATRKCEGFTVEEMAIIDEVLREYGDKDARALVDMTHQEWTWKSTRRNEDIPYFLAFYRHYKRPSEAEAASLLEHPDYAESIKRRLKECVAA